MSNQVRSKLLLPTAGDIESVQAPSVRCRVPLPMLLQGERLEAQIVSFSGLRDRAEHVAVVFGQLSTDEPRLVRIHSECLTGDVLGSSRCDCGPQLSEAINMLSEHGGVLLYLRQEGRGIGLYNKLDACELQDRGMDTYAANEQLGFPADARDFGVAGEMLNALGVRNITLLSNNPEKRRQIEEYGITVAEQRSTRVHLSANNKKYLAAKVAQGGHLILLAVGEHE